MTFENDQIQLGNPFLAARPPPTLLICCRRTGCEEGEELQAGLCYPKCREGYAGSGPVCWQVCPKRYHGKHGVTPCYTWTVLKIRRGERLSACVFCEGFIRA